MKLEVGQKIGIYEALNNFLFVEKGSQYLGFDDCDKTHGKWLLKKDNKTAFMSQSEVRLVASLRVKAVK
jgi:hypothetical protein